MIILLIGLSCSALFLINVFFGLASFGGDGQVVVNVILGIVFGISAIGFIGAFFGEIFNHAADLAKVRNADKRIDNAKARVVETKNLLDDMSKALTKDMISAMNNDNPVSSVVSAYTSAQKDLTREQDNKVIIQTRIDERAIGPYNVITEWYGVA